MSKANCLSLTAFINYNYTFNKPSQLSCCFGYFCLKDKNNTFTYQLSVQSKTGNE